MMVRRARSIQVPSGTDGPAMRLARLRRFAVMLVLVLLTGLALPALASTLSRAAPAKADGAAALHVHADGKAHGHAKPAEATGQQAVHAGHATPATAPCHCPGCLTAAECALSCLGAAVLPASVQPPAGSAARPWTAARDLPLLAFVPAGDLDPPRPVPVR